MELTQITGNVGIDAKLMNANGKDFLSFTVAVNRNYKNANGETVEKTNWYSVTTRQTNLAEYIKKGKKVFVLGTPNILIFQDKNGESQIGYNLHANIIDLLSPKDKEENEEK